MRNYKRDNEVYIMALSVYEVIQAINQIAADSMDHQYGGRETGVLQREEGDFIKDSRVIDGFGAKINGKNLILTYHTEVNIKRSHEEGFEAEIEKYLDDLATFIKKEFKGDTGSTLTLKEKEETYKAVMQQTSNVRTFVQAQKIWEIGQLKDLPDYDEEQSDRDAIVNKLDRMLNENYKPELAWKKFTGDF